MKAKNILIYVLEDDDWYNKLLVHSLSLNPDYVVKGFLTAKDLLTNMKDNPDVVTLDYRLPDISGSKVLEKIKASNPNTEVIIISEQDDVATAIDLIKTGAYDYLVKEKDIRNKLLLTVNHILKKNDLQKQVTSLQKEVGEKYNNKTALVGDSSPMKKISGLIEKAISSNISVMVTGETGTGKEVVAKAIHYNSVGKKNPFVAINVASVPHELVESELFGHEKGAFTGAISRRTGKFEEANGGTLFLDEIGEMNIHMQAKLLRALQEKEIYRVGSNTPIKINCRIITATHRDLMAEIKKGSFREDLYYRLYGLTIELPPLREREKDALLLANHFMSGFCKENNIPEKAFTENAKQKLLSYHFPGNVRELKAVVELSVVMAGGNEINAEDIKLNSGNELNDILSEEVTLKEYNKRLVDSYLKKYDNNVKLVAKKLDIGQSTIYRMLKS